MKVHGHHSGSYNLSDIKRAAAHLGLPTSAAKGALIDSIVSKVVNNNYNFLFTYSNYNLQMEKRAALKDIIVKDNNGTFRSDKNTFFRVLNILMQSPDAVARSNMLAGRLQLQERQTYL